MEILFPVAVSLLAQWLKKFSPNEWATLGIVAVLSLVAAGVYTYLESSGYWQAFLNILVVAGAIYTYIIKRFE